MRWVFSAALVIAALAMNNDTNAQQGFYISVKATPQFSFIQNKDDNDNNSIDRKATFNASFGVGAAYNFTRKSGVGVDVLYSAQGQRYNANGYETYRK
jgi:hypothetical protein